MKTIDPLRRMYAAYGKDFAHICAHCPNLRPTKYLGLEITCMCYSDQADEAWSPQSTACGHFGRLFEPKREHQVIRLYERTHQGTADGQCTMLEAPEKERNLMESDTKMQVTRCFLPAAASSLDLLEELARAETSADAETAEACRAALRSLHGRSDSGKYSIAVDFDGTLCENDEFPLIGDPREDIITYLTTLRRTYGVRLILHTCRVEDRLREAVAWCRGHGLVFDAINENLPERIAVFGGDCRKISADEYWDDRAVCL